MSSTLGYKQGYFVKNILIPFALFFSSVANAVSFDCQEAKGSIELAICENKELGELDDKLAVKYFKSKLSLPEERASLFLKEQRAWLSSRSKKCNDKSTIKICLIKLYKERIQNLDSLIFDCTETGGYSQQGNCMSSNSLNLADNELEMKYVKLIEIFDNEINKKNYGFPFERMKKALISSQKSWKKYREDQCSYDIAIDATAAGASGIEFDCYEKYSKKRLEFIEIEIEEWIDGTLK